MDFLNCVVNKDVERVVLPTDTSFNASCETLAMRGIGNGTATQPGVNYSEATALHPNMAVGNYAAIQHS